MGGADEDMAGYGRLKHFKPQRWAPHTHRLYCKVTHTSSAEQGVRYLLVSVVFSREFKDCHFQVGKVLNSLIHNDWSDLNVFFLAKSHYT